MAEKNDKMYSFKAVLVDDFCFYCLREEDFIQAMTAARPKGPVEKLADMIRDFPAEDIWEMERYAEFLASRREPKKKKATTGPMGTELPENWRRA